MAPSAERRRRRGALPANLVRGQQDFGNYFLPKESAVASR
jgi:hypothetical protein